MSKCTVPDAELNKSRGSDYVLLETLLNSYQQNYSREPKRLLSFFTRMVVESKVIPKIVEDDLSTEPYFMETETSSARSVLIRRESDFSGSFFSWRKPPCTVLLIRHVMKNVVEICFGTWAALFTRVPGTYFFRKYEMKSVRRSMLLWRILRVFLAEADNKIQTSSRRVRDRKGGTRMLCRILKKRGWDPEVMPLF